MAMISHDEPSKMNEMAWKYPIIEPQKRRQPPAASRLPPLYLLVAVLAGQLQPHVEGRHLFQLEAISQAQETIVRAKIVHLEGHFVAQSETSIAEKRIKLVEMAPVFINCRLVFV